MATDEQDDKAVDTTPLAPSVGYLWYLGFAAQIPWTIILVYLPLIEPLLGGVLFSFAVGIAMGLACNVVRFLVVVFGRKFTFKIRVIWGSLCSAFFTFGFFAIVLVGSNFPHWPQGVDSIGFWLGLIVALLGGAGNAQLMSTGYGVSALISKDKPIASNLFFFGQATASASCWPLKLVVERIASSSLAQTGISMCLISLISLSVIPMFVYRLSKFSAIEKPTTSDQTALTVANAKRVLANVWIPGTCLWLTYFCTNLVTPGQLMLWGLPETDSSSAFLTDHKLYRSLCSYTHLLADAVGKSVLVVVSLRPIRIKSLLNFKYSLHIAVFLLLARFAIVAFFFIPPSAAGARFAFLAIFGLLNGFVASLCLSLSIHRAEPQDTDITGYISSFIIINGLFAGSLSGMVIHAASH